MTGQSPGRTGGERESGGATSGGDGCLSEGQVLAIVAGEGESTRAGREGEERTEEIERVRAHVASCGACAARVEGARKDEVFLSRVREVVGGSLGPAGMPRIAGYRLVGVVSSGSQGVVYRGVQEGTSREVAIKVLGGVGEGDGTSSRRQRWRAEREAEIAARLRHPNIVTVYESRALPDGRVAVVMEYVEGVALDAWVAAGETAGQRRRAMLEVFASVCGAVHHAHLNAVIHRDLKPENILVTGEGRAVVLDFGVARAGEAHATLTGEFAGTPAYASPEQAAGHPGEVDALTDVYSLGVILYRVLSGRLPYALEGTLFEMARTISEERARPLGEVCPGVAADLAAIVERAMEKEKGRRYQSAAALGRDIERFLRGEPVEARSASGWYLLRKAVRLNRSRLAAAGLAAAVLAGAGLAVAWSLSRAASEKARAHEEQVQARAVTQLLREVLPNPNPSNPVGTRVLVEGFARLYTKLETGEFASDPEADLVIRRLWAGTYRDLGKGRAEALVPYAELSLRNAIVRLRQTTEGPERGLADALHDLARVLVVRGRLGEAKELAEEALGMRAELSGADGAEASSTRELLGRVLLGSGDAHGAARESERALAGLRSSGASGEEIGSACETAARALLELGGDGLGRADGLAVECVTQRVRVSAMDDREMLDAIELVGAVARQLPAGRCGELVRGVWGGVEDDGADESVAQAALEADVRVMGSLGLAFDEMPRVTGRTGAARRMLVLARRVLAEEDAGVCRALVAWMFAARGEGLWEEHMQAAREASDALARRFGENDPGVRMCVEEAASTAAACGKPADAAGFARRVMRINESAAEEVRDRVVMINSRRHLAWYLTMAGEASEAEREWRRAMEDSHRVFGAEHHLSAMTEAGLAHSLADLGRTEEALERSARAIETAEALETTAQDQLAHICVSRAHVLRCAGRGVEIEELSERAWEMFYRMLDRRHAWRRVLVGDAIEGAVARGDRESEAKWRSRLEASGPIGG